MKRIITTGSRMLSDPELLHTRMGTAAWWWPNEPLLLVHGRCDPRLPWGDRLPVRWNQAMMLPMDQQRKLLGADWQAHLYAESMGWGEEHHPAHWREHGRKAGFVRNAQMVALGANVLIAAPEPGLECKGTRMCAGLAAKAGIDVLPTLMDFQWPGRPA